MRKIAPFLLLFPLAVARALAQPVSSSCVGEIKADGSLDRNGCNPSPPPGGSGGGFTPLQQAQLNAAQGVGQAVGGAFVNWLLSPAPADVGRQQQERERLRRIQASNEKRQSDRAGFEARRDQTVSEWKDQDSPPPPDAGQLLAGLKDQVRTVNCAMAEIYKKSESMGPNGRAFAKDLRQQVLEAEKSFAADASDAAKGDRPITAMSLDLMSEGKKESMQLIVEGTIGRDPKSGNMNLSVLYQLDKKGRRTKLGQNIASIDPLGGISCMEVSRAMAKCMRNFNASADTNYCPNPPRPEEPAAPAQSGGEELKD